MPEQNLDRKLGVRQISLPVPQPLLVVLSGPSGVGKDAVLNRMRELERPYHYVVTATTRPRRPGERDGIDYHFLSQQEFQRMIKEGQFLEWAEVYGHLYGVPKREISLAISKGTDAIVKVDVQGAATIKKILPQAVFIFLMPPSMEELERRLKNRHSESPADLELRLKKAREEMKKMTLFHYVLINHRDKVDDVVTQIDTIIAAERCRVRRKAIKL